MAGGGDAPTLLLVDDEADACEVGKILLERDGFRVLTALDGAEAIEVFRRHQAICIVSRQHLEQALMQRLG